MVNELVDVYSRLKSIEADLSLVNYRLDKITDCIDKIADLGQIVADDGIVEELPITEPNKEEIFADVCDNYCRYSTPYYQVDEGLESKCRECPLNKLLDDGR